MSTTKNDIVIEIAQETEVEQQKVKVIVQLTFDKIIETLVREGRLELRNFGVFEVRTRKARKARNPKTGAEVMVPGKNVVSFKPGKIMEARVEKEVKPMAAPVKPLPRPVVPQSAPPAPPNA